MTLCDFCRASCRRRVRVQIGTKDGMKTAYACGECYADMTREV